jgi:hypothetical protein
MYFFVEPQQENDCILTIIDNRSEKARFIKNKIHCYVPIIDSTLYKEYIILGKTSEWEGFK